MSEKYLEKFRGRTIEILEFETAGDLRFIPALEYLPDARATYISGRFTPADKKYYQKEIMITGVYPRVTANEGIDHWLAEYIRIGRRFDIIFCGGGRRFARALLSAGGIILYKKPGRDLIVENAPAAARTKTILLNNREYTVNNDEFISIPSKFDKIRNVTHLTELEREAYFWKKMERAGLIDILVHHYPIAGGFLPLNCPGIPHHIMCMPDNFCENIKRENNNLKFVEPAGEKCGLSIQLEIKDTETPAAIYSSSKQNLSAYKEYIHFNRFVYIRKDLRGRFEDEFAYCLAGEHLELDNLIHLTIMVKDAGAGFRDILRENLPFIDEWTILDTGSTDETIDIVREIMPPARGKLYCEPFINFRDSRNRCLDLAGDDCVFTIMLDDTYVLAGEIVEFLREVRSDQHFQSFSIFIEDNYLQYQSNRILRTCQSLRYMYRMHEIIETNYAGGIPKDCGYIKDIKSEFMHKRSAGRKDYDLKMLLLDLEEKPGDARVLYYLAETHFFRHEFTAAFLIYMRRTEITRRSFLPEIQDSYFKMGMIARDYYKDWEMAEFYFTKSYEFNKEKYEGLAMIAEHYYLAGDSRAWDMFKICWDQGIPDESKHTFSRYKIIYEYWVPKRMSEYFFLTGDKVRGEQILNSFPLNPPADY